MTSEQIEALKQIGFVVPTQKGTFYYAIVRLDANDEPLPVSDNITDGITKLIMDDPDNQ